MADWPYNTTRWQRLRKLKLAEKPFCEVCDRRGKVVAANTVDHVLAIAKGGDPFPSLDQLMSLCASCHSTKTNAVDRSGGDGVAFKGCDVAGVPIDPSHPFMGRGGSKDHRASALDQCPPSDRVSSESD